MMLGLKVEGQEGGIAVWKNRFIFLTGTLAAMCAILFLTRVVMAWETSGTTAGEEVPARNKVAYLTFDDGPSSLTGDYLDILKKEGVPATFFLIGQQIEGEMEDVVRREVEEGHELGLHSYTHQADKIYQTGETYKEDLEQTREKIRSCVSFDVKNYRFPWGSANAYIRWYKKELTAELEGQGLMYQDWNVSGEDSVGCPSAYSILSHVRKDFEKYDDPVILLHDSATCKATLEALQEIIRELKEKGYRFDVLSNRQEPCHFSR